MSVIDQIIGAESSGNPYARNPRSSAAGLGQFTDRTWLATIARHRPDLLERYSPQELLNLRTDSSPFAQTLNKQMIGALAGDNGDFLHAHGLPTTPATLYLAHFAGAQGATNLLNADGSAPVSSVLSSSAIDANPFLKNMTVSQLRQWAANKAGSPTTGAAPSSAPSGPFEQFAEINPEPPPLTPPKAPVTTSPTSFPSSGTNAATPGSPAGAFSALGAVPKMIAGFNQQDEPTLQPPQLMQDPASAMARARILASIMQGNPLTGGV